MASPTVVVAGAGIAGLRAATLVADAGYDVRVFESASTVGGRVRTERTDGYQFDRGFQVLLTAYPTVRDALDLESLDVRRFPPGAIVCRPNHRSTIADPLRAPMKAVETAFSRDITIGDKIRTLSLRRDLGSKRREQLFAGSDSSIAEYLQERGFSERYVENFAAPFYGGITLDRSLSTSSRIFEFTFKLLAEGHAAVPAGGMGAISEQLADAASEVGVSIVTDAAVESIESSTDGATVTASGSNHRADAVIVATDPRTSKRLTGVQTIPTAGRSCVTQYLSLPAGSPLDDQPYIMLNAAGAVPNQVAPISVVAPEYTPDDELLLSATTLGDPDRNAEELFERTRDALSSWYPAASFDDLTLLETVRCQFAQFAQPPGIHETLPGPTAPQGPVFLAGDYTETSSIDGALRSGESAARAVIDELEE